MRFRWTHSFAAVALVIAAHAGASAQTPPSNAGPLVIERVYDSVIVAPDYNVTEFDDEFGQLAGVYAGRVIYESILIGGAAYWLVDGDGPNELTYGGLLVGWSTSPARRVQFGARA